MSKFRQQMPECAESIDLFRSVFGHDVKVIAAVEGDLQVLTNEKKGESEMYVMSSQEFLAIGRLDRDMAAMRERKAGRGKK